MLSFPANPINGDQYTDDNGKVWQFDGVKWNIATTESSKQFSGVKVSLSTQAFLSNTLSTVEFDVEDYDTSNFFDSGTPSTIIIPQTGYYRINLLVLTSQEGSGASYTVQLRRNAGNLFTSTMSAFQSGTYNEILLLNGGDEIKLYASEEESVGSILEDSFLIVELVGYSFGSSLRPGFEFSGVKMELQSDVNTTSTPTAITWSTNDVVFNVNASAAGNVYWQDSSPTRFTIATGGYYRIRSFLLTGIDGSADSYTIVLRLNGATVLETVSLGANESAAVDETYNLSSNDYIEIVVSNSESLGLIQAASTFFEIIRLGV